MVCHQLLCNLGHVTVHLWPPCAHLKSETGECSDIHVSFQSWVLSIRSLLLLSPSFFGNSATCPWRGGPPSSPLTFRDAVESHTCSRLPSPLVSAFSLQIRDYGATLRSHASFGRPLCFPCLKQKLQSHLVSSKLW